MMLLILKAMLFGFMCDYIATTFCRIAENVAFIETYKNRKIYASYRITVYGPRLIYTVDRPFIFIPSNDWGYIKVFSLDDARYKIDQEIKDSLRVKFYRPIRKLRII